MNNFYDWCNGPSMGVNGGAWGQGQVMNPDYRMAQQQANACSSMRMGLLANATPARWGTPAQLKLDRALEIAADVRARHPEMQVQRRTRTEV
jgi:hypothetical protein